MGSDRPASLSPPALASRHRTCPCPTAFPEALTDDQLGAGAPAPSPLRAPSTAPSSSRRLGSRPRGHRRRQHGRRRRLISGADALAARARRCGAEAVCPPVQPPHVPDAPPRPASSFSTLRAHKCTAARPCRVALAGAARCDRAVDRAAAVDRRTTSRHARAGGAVPAAAAATQPAATSATQSAAAVAALLAVATAVALAAAAAAKPSAAAPVLPPSAPPSPPTPTLPPPSRCRRLRNPRRRQRRLGRSRSRRRARRPSRRTHGHGLLSHVHVHVRFVCVSSLGLCAYFAVFHFVFSGKAA